MNNPLLENFDLPPFSRIRPENIKPAIEALLKTNREILNSLLKNNESYTWKNLITPLEKYNDRLNRTWSPVSHMHSVVDSHELREAYNECLIKLTEYMSELGQNEELFSAYKQIFNSVEFPALDESQQKIISNKLRDFRLAGIELDEIKRARFREIQLRLSKLQSQFEENVLDATHGWSKLIINKSELSGLPNTVIALTLQNANRAKQKGWLITLDFPCYMPVMKYAENRLLREEVYKAYVTRASNEGPCAGKWNNNSIMEEILALRQEQACLLGYKCYAGLSLVKKMAGSPDDVLSFLRDLADRSKTIAKNELEELARFASEHYQHENLAAWDIAFYSEKLKEFKFDFSQESLRPYFPVPQVLDGMFSIVNKLFGITINEIQGIDVWHTDVKFFEIRDNNNQPRGSFYLDLYARPNKRGGAWMDECVVRMEMDDYKQEPVAYLTCNFSPPVGENPSLLTHDEVITLFHEFGHGLHHLLTLIKYPGVAGINGVPWDAVELPSQFMENWCWEDESLAFIARHYQTGETIPPGMLDKMKKARNFQSGLQMLRQLEYALFDFLLHSEENALTAEDIQVVLNDVRAEVAVIEAPSFNRFQNGFTHIFAGGYAAGYYSYKWAEVLSADAFSKFEEKGIFDEHTGREFLQAILEQGGSRDPMELFLTFRGRKPSIEALLRHSGIIIENDSEVVV